MLRGAQEGLFGPTNQENAVGASKSQYCCREEEKIRRPEFASKTPDLAVYEKGGISPAARKLLLEEIRVGRRTSLTHRSHLSLSRDAWWTQRTHAQQRRVRVSAAPSTTIGNPSI
jgi:hypothetical protein